MGKIAVIERNWLCRQQRSLATTASGMIVCAIVAILAAIALPSYRESVFAGRRADGANAWMFAAAVVDSRWNTDVSPTS